MGLEMAFPQCLRRVSVAQFTAISVGASLWTQHAAVTCIFADEDPWI